MRASEITNQLVIYDLQSIYNKTSHFHTVDEIAFVRVLGQRRLSRIYAHERLKCRQTNCGFFYQSSTTAWSKQLIARHRRWCVSLYAKLHFLFRDPRIFRIRDLATLNRPSIAVLLHRSTKTTTVPSCGPSANTDLEELREKYHATSNRTSKRHGSEVAGSIEHQGTIIIVLLEKVDTLAQIPRYIVTT